jgi:AcrR family transcriptional regulator
METQYLPKYFDIKINKQGQELRRKGRITRQKFLDATFYLLHSDSLDQVTVPNIASRVDLSTATFYLYFSDIDEIYLELSERAGEDLHELLKFLEVPWPLAKVFENSLAFVSAFMDVVRLHRPVIHLRNARADRNDSRFDKVRLRSARPLIQALGRQLRRSESLVGSPEIDFSEAVGAVLFTGLERLSIRLCGPDAETADAILLLNAQAQVIADSIAAARNRLDVT